MLTVPATSERLITRTKPCRFGLGEPGNNGMRCMPESSAPGAFEDRFVRRPVEPPRRLTTVMGLSAETVSRQLPVPSPKAPVNVSSPDSSSPAMSVRALRAAIDTTTSVPGVSP